MAQPLLHMYWVLSKMFSNVLWGQLPPGLGGSSHASSRAQKKSKIASSANSGWRAAAEITSSLQNNVLKTKGKKAGTESAAFCDEVLSERGKNPCKLQSAQSLWLGKVPAGHLGQDGFSLLLSGVICCLIMVLVVMMDWEAEAGGIAGCPVSQPAALQWPGQGLDSAIDSLDVKWDVVTWQVRQRLCLFSAWCKEHYEICRKLPKIAPTCLNRCEMSPRYNKEINSSTILK